MTKYDVISPDIIEFIKVNGVYPQKGGTPVKVLCEHFGIAEDTWYRWIQETDFSEAVKKANRTFSQVTVDEIVNALKKKALGYEYTEMTEEAGVAKTVTYDRITGKKVKEVQGDELKTMKARRQTVNVPPDTGAAIFLLTNLDPEKWKNRQNNDIEGNIKVVKPVVVFNEDPEPGETDAAD